MKVIYRNKFETNPQKFRSDIISDQLFKWLDNGLLVTLILSFVLAKYIPYLNTNNVTTTVLRYYTAAFIALHSVLKATNLFKSITTNKSVDDIYTKQNLFRVLAFIGAFAISIVGILAFNKDQVSVSEMLTALGMSIFPFSLTEIFDSSTSYLDLVMNGVYAVLLSSGLVSVYFNKNMMGLFSVIALGMHSLYGFMKDKFEKKNVPLSREHLITMGLSGLSILAMVISHVKKINMELPDFNQFFRNVGQ